MPFKLRIPDSYVAPLAALAQLTPDELAAFIEAIRGQEPTLDVVELTRLIATRLSVDRKRMDGIVRLLARLQVVREDKNLSIGEFLRALRAAIEQSGKDELHPSNWEAFESAITEALSGTNALALSSKAFRVMAEHSHLYCSAKVLTDLRPIFRSDVDQGPATFVAVHTLRLTYHESEEHKEFFVALDRGDIELLAAALTRALEKEASLRTFASEKSISILKR